MKITIDHLVLPASDYEASARTFANIMELEYNGVDKDAPHFAPVRVNETFTLVFMNVANPQDQHVAFKISEDKFAQIQKNLDTANVRYGNSPRDFENMETDHPFGGQGLFFVDTNSHLFEVFTKARGNE
jgi:catechol 2,3-dioxygenase-like lactoylglutathione lyase family enzyme